MELLLYEIVDGFFVLLCSEFRDKIMYLSEAEDRKIESTTLNELPSSENTETPEDLLNLHKKECTKRKI